MVKLQRLTLGLTESQCVTVDRQLDFKYLYRILLLFILIIAPDQYTITTVPVKIIRLLATDLTAKIEEEEDQAAESDYDDEDEFGEFGEDDWEDEESNQKDKFAMLSDFLDASGLDMEGEDDEEQEADPDVLADPVYQMNMKDCLVDFFRQCVQQNSPAFAQSVTELSDVEKRTLSSLLEN